MWLFLYMSVYNPNGKKTKSNCNYKKAFGDAYSEYELYIFYDSNNKIIYIGEAAEEEFKDRLSQHFNESDGGLRNKLSSKPNRLSKLMASKFWSFMENIIKTIREALIILKYVIPPQLKRIALILENVSKLFVLNFVYVSLTN